MSFDRFRKLEDQLFTIVVELNDCGSAAGFVCDGSSGRVDHKPLIIVDHRMKMRHKHPPLKFTFIFAYVVAGE